MKNGNWVPISKALVRKLPSSREFSEVEAMFSITVDFDNGSPVSISGYASLWMWSRKRVSNFLKKYDLEIDYVNKFDPHQKGQVRNKWGAGKVASRGQVEFINSKGLRLQENKSRAGEAQVGDRKGSTTNEPNPKPVNNTASGDAHKVESENTEVYISQKKKKLTGKVLQDFMDFWKDFNFMKGKAAAADAFLSVYSPEVLDDILAGAKREANNRQSLLEQGRTPKWAQGWLSGRRWEDESGINSQGVPVNCEICNYRHRYNCQQESKTCKNFIPIAN